MTGAILRIRRSTSTAPDMIRVLVGKELISFERNTPSPVIESACAKLGITKDQLQAAFLNAALGLKHEIERVRRRIDSDEEKDRREYLESWIADFECQRKALLNLLDAEGAAQ
jgi:hypothetical protein